MASTTYFTGEFTVTPPLSDEMRDYLHAFSSTRRMTRDADMLADTPDPLREALGLPLGEEGQHFVAGKGDLGADQTPDVLHRNDPPEGQPTQWCHWTPTSDGQHIEWDNSPVRDDAEIWLAYLIAYYLEPRGYVLNGQAQWEGRDPRDFHIVRVVDNEVACVEGRTVEVEVDDEF